MNYLEATKTLDNRSSKKIANNTYLKQLNDCIGLLYHDTYIIKFYSDYMILDNGGYYTMTTKERLNTFGIVGIYQKNSIWYLSDNSAFYNGVKIDYSSNVINPKDPKKDEDQNKKLKLKINKYSSKFIEYINKGKLQIPSGGDCWFCAMKTDQNMALGDATKNNQHLLDHIAENYFVPSLLFNAIKEAGYGNPELIYSVIQNGNFDDAKNILTKYIYKRLR